jgi:uncharacterized protein YgiB involved in biofilm formation
MIKRSFSSQSIPLGRRLLGLSAVVAVPLALGGCKHTDTKSGIYPPDPNACIAADILSADQCRHDFAEAVAENTRLAPQYATDSDCKQDWAADPDDQSERDPCQVTIVGGHVFYSPHMAGYWAGVTTTSEGSGAPSTQKTFSYPVYQNANGLSSPATDQSFDTFGEVTDDPDFDTAHDIESAPRPVFEAGESFSRGGFGGEGHGFGGGE